MGKIGAIYGVRVPLKVFNVQTISARINKLDLCLHVFMDSSFLYVGAPIHTGDDGGPFGLSRREIDDLYHDSSDIASRLKGFEIENRYLGGRTVEQSLRVYDVLSLEPV